MIAIDTNVVVRYLASDDPVQGPLAWKLVGGGDVFVSTGVVLETAWVLLNVRGFQRAAVVRALRAFAGLPGIAIQDARAVEQALDWAEQGLDFADAIHLAQAADCKSFASFDRALAKAAARLEAKPPVRAPA